jgi:hypothetical protein
VVLRRRLAVLVAAVMLLVAVFAGTARAQNQYIRGIGGVQSSTATEYGSAVGEGRTTGAQQQRREGSYVAPGAQICGHQGG